MKNYIQIAKSIAMYGQLGFTLVTPPIILVLITHWLQRRFAWSSWLMLVAILIGLLSSAAGAYHFYRKVMEKEKKENKKRSETVSFYTHE